ncbi:hypothetical protein OAU25_00660 [Crocinitomicaceae bacterium]|nr:hypothetical protein [Crocinitomicaceae bacterium]
MGCKKEEIIETPSKFIEVEKKNSSLFFQYASLTEPASGGVAYDLFSDALEDYDSLYVLATLMSGNLGGANNDSVYDSHIDTFNLSGAPNFQANSESLTLPEAVEAHQSSDVIVNSAYELEFDSDKIYVNTTTEFFKYVTKQDYYLTAYIIVDSIVANQAGHPNGANTYLRKTIVDVGRIPGYSKNYHGYKVATGAINNGHKFNLRFEADRLSSWSDIDQISVALVITKFDPFGKPIFVNAHTKH